MRAYAHNSTPPYFPSKTPMQSIRQLSTSTSNRLSTANRPHLRNSQEFPKAQKARSIPPSYTRGFLFSGRSLAAFRHPRHFACHGPEADQAVSHQAIALAEQAAHARSCEGSVID